MRLLNTTYKVSTETCIANSPLAKLVIGMLTSKMQEDKVDEELPDIDALIE